MKPQKKDMRTLVLRDQKHLPKGAKVQVFNLRQRKKQHRGSGHKPQKSCVSKLARCRKQLSFDQTNERDRRGKNRKST